MDEPGAVPQPSGERRVWFCHACGQMIRPPGSEGTADLDGNRFCDACAPARVQSPPTRVEPVSKGRPSSKRLQAVARVEPAQRSRKSSVRLKAVTPDQLKGERPHAAGPAPPPSRRTALWVGLALAGLPLLAALVWALAASGEKGDAGKSTPPAPVAETPAGGWDSTSKSSEAVPPPAKVADAPPAPPPDVAKAAEPAKAEPKAAAPAAHAKPPRDFAKNLKDAEALVKAGKYSGATRLLDDLKAKHGEAPWWADEEKNWTQVRAALDQQYKEYKEEAQDVRESLRKEAGAGFLEATEAAWKPRAESGDELAVEPAREILQAIAGLRVKQADRARAKRIEEIGQKLDEFEKLLKGHPSAKALEPALKFVEELEPQFAADPELGAPLAERFAGFRFDAQLARDGELSLLHGLVKPLGAMAELSYDFSTPEQFRAWTFDKPGQVGPLNNAQHDEAKGVVVINAKGEHGWDGTDRKGMGVLRLPFHFRPENWAFEADVAALSHKDVKNEPDLGILIWDGGQLNLRLGLRDASTPNGPKKTMILAAGCLDKDRQQKYVKDLGDLPIPVTDTVRLVMACRQNAITLGALVQGKPVPFRATVHLPFVPKYAGLYVRNREKDESSGAVFDNVKLTVIPDLEVLKAQAATLREVAVAKAKGDLAARAELAREVREASAGLCPTDWEKNWSYEGRSDKDAHQKMVFRNRNGVWRTFPFSKDKAAKWVRRVTLESGKTCFLHLEVTSHEANTDWQLVVKANGKELLSKTIKTATWLSFDVDLGEYAGQEVLLEMLNKAAGEFKDDYGYWDRVYLGRKP